MKRSLYQCGNARVLGDEIYCKAGRKLENRAYAGNISLRRLARGDPLILDVCQDCNEFDCMGPPIPKEERGWL